MKHHTIQVDPSKCIGCGLCSKDCPAHNIEIKEGKAQVLTQTCIMCSHCAAICPKEAISLTGFEEEQIPITHKKQLQPEEVLNVIRFRKTIRQFQAKEVPTSLLQQILEAGRLTHTAKNMQDVSFIVLDKEKACAEKKAVRIFRKIKPLANLVSSMAKRTQLDENFFFFQAPLVIVIAAKDVTNGILAAQNMEFVAEAGGLGVLYSGFFTMCTKVSPALRKQIKLPKGKKVATTLVLGYPAINYQRSTQRDALDVTYL